MHITILYKDGIVVDATTWGDKISSDELKSLMESVTMEEKEVVKNEIKED